MDVSATSLKIYGDGSAGRISADSSTSRFRRKTRQCGKPNCRCAGGERPHAEFLLPVLPDGKAKTTDAPWEMAEEVRSNVVQRKRFEKTAAQVARLSLRRFLLRREK